MKITITQTALREVKEHRKALASALKVLTDSNSELLKLEALHETLSEEIPALEKSVNYDDAAAVKRLMDKKGKRDLVAQKLRDLSHAAPDSESLSILLGKSGQVIRIALSKTFERIEKEIADKLRPYFRNWGKHAQIARETDFLREFVAYHSISYTLNGADIGAARAALQMLDEIIGGEIKSWKFDPEAKI